MSKGIPTVKELFEPYEMTPELEQEVKEVDLFTCLEIFSNARVTYKGMHYHYKRMLWILTGRATQ